MSRVGKTPITIVTNVSIIKDGDMLTVKGPKGELTVTIPYAISVDISGGVCTISTTGTDKKASALHGFYRAHIANMVNGVTVGWTKTLELVGVGYRAAMSGTDLVLSVGFSHQITVKPPSGITFLMQDGKVLVTGIDRQKVGQVAADIRKFKAPEPYKGKGIKYVGEYVRRKAGKSAKAVGGVK
jgi:large subunit ribosomal protein L6